MTKLTLLEKLNLILLSFKSQLGLYKEFKNDPNGLKFLFSMNRTPLWDISNNKFFTTNFKSKGHLNDETQPNTKEHYFNRILSSRFIFNELEKDENMSLDRFTEICKDLCSVVILTKEEHKLATNMSRGTNRPGYLFYEKCGIEINGFDEYMKNIEGKYHLNDWYNNI
jgi:hypothetical protein